MREPSSSSDPVLSPGTGGAFYGTAFSMAVLGGCEFTGNQAQLGNAAAGADGGAVTFEQARP